ncbi:TPA: lambda exonuclease family protein [Neisseria weaveri]
MKQGTEEWFAARLGKVTASRVSDIVAKTKSGYSASRKNYMAELLCERLTGTQQDGFKSAPMQRGTDLEPKARAVYMIETGRDVTEVGMIPHPSIENSGASPDGLVGNDGLIEIKCPNTATHLEFIRSEKPMDKYYLQMQWQMACTGRAWCDFVSYDDRLINRLAYKCIRVMRDDETIKHLENEVSKFLSELEDLIKELEEKC